MNLAGKCAADASGLAVAESGNEPAANPRGFSSHQICRGALAWDAAATGDNVIKAIFWDNDGVLVDTERLYYRATRQVMATAGVTLSQAQYVALFMVQGGDAWQLVAERGFGPAEIETLRARRNALYSTMLDGADLVIDGVRPVLDALHEQYAMSIVTSCRADHFARIHAATDLLPYFRFVLTRGDYERSKPDPEPYLLALARSGCRADECIVVEDSQRGLAAASAAGLRCIVVPNALTRGGDFAAACKIVDSVTAIPAQLDVLMR